TARVNDIRAKNGLTPLMRIRSLDKAAYQHASYMAKTDRMSHDGFASRVSIIRWQSENPGSKYVGENCGKCAGTLLDTGVVKAAVNRWMKSDGHRDAILNPVYNRTGIASVTNEGNVYIVQVFAGDGVKAGRRLPAVSATPAFSGTPQ
ncbi:MAG: CAP domain-containing protein, partial [Candidatus Omnitrophota bacterium]